MLENLGVNFLTEIFHVTASFFLLPEKVLFFAGDYFMTKRARVTVG